MGTFDFQFFLLVVLFIIVLAVFVTRHLRIRYKYDECLTPISPDSLPEILKATFDNVTDIFKKNNLEPIGDFKSDYRKRFICFYRFFKNSNEQTYGLIFAGGLGHAYFVTLELLTEFLDAPTVVTLNERRYVLPVAEGTYRQFPNCMPEDLVRLHKEYVDTITSERKPLPEDKDLPARIIYRGRENRDFLVKKRIFEKAKEEGYLKFNFWYLLFSNFREMVRIITFKPRPFVVRDKAYTRGFIHLQGSRFNKNINIGKARKRKPVPVWVWVLVFFTIFIILLIPNIIFEYHNRPSEPTAHEIYSKIVADQNRKIFTFGEMPAVELNISLNRIETWLSEKFNPGAEGLNPGLTRGQIDKLLEGLPLKPVEELYTLYTWRNGQKKTINNRAVVLSPWGRFLPLEEAVTTYKELKQTKTRSRKEYTLGIWEPYYFPIFAHEAYYFIVLCSGDKQGAVVKNTKYANYNEVAFPSIAGLVQGIAECFDTGAFYVNDEGFIDIDQEKELSVLKKYHPAIYTADFTYRSRPVETTTNPDGSKVVTSTQKYGLKRVKRFDAQNRLIERSAYLGDKIIQSIRNEYDDQGRIKQRTYKREDGVFKRVNWDYKTGSEVVVTIDMSGTIIEIKANVDAQGNWSV